MSSNGDRSQVTLQVQLAANRSKKAIETELDLTVDKFKLLLADLTGIPSHQQCLVYKGHTLENPQTLRSYELKPDHTVHLVRRGLTPSTPVVSLSRNSNPTFPRETTGLNAFDFSQNMPNNQLLNKSLDVLAIIKSIPVLCRAAQEPEVAKMLENTVILRCVLSYLFYHEIYRGKASDEADVMKNIKAQIEGYKLKCIYDDQQSITTRGTRLSEMEQARGSDDLVEPSLRHNVHKGAIDNFVEILLSDATISRHYKEQGESIDRAIIATLGWDDASQNRSSPGIGGLGAPLNTRCSPYQKLLLALPDDEDYNSSSSSTDVSDDISIEEEESEELLGSQLTEMEEMGFMNWQENLRALLNSGADVEKAVEKLLEKTYPDEGKCS